MIGSAVFQRGSSVAGVPVQWQRSGHDISTKRWRAHSRRVPLSEAVYGFASSVPLSLPALGSAANVSHCAAPSSKAHSPFLPIDLDVQGLDPDRLSVRMSVGPFDLSVCVCVCV